MHLILQLIRHMGDNQKLSRDLLNLQMLGYCQLPVSLFLILLTGSIAQYNFSENHIDFSKEIDP